MKETKGVRKNDNSPTPYADTQGILKMNSNFTVKTVKTYRNEKKSL